MFWNDWLSRRSIYTPQRVAILDDSNGQSYTYAQLQARASRLAGQLKGRWGIQAEDRVACVATNCIEYIDLFFAIAKLGAVLVPLNHRMPAAALLELLRDCQPQLLVYEQQFSDVALVATEAGAVQNQLAMHASDQADCSVAVATIVANAQDEAQVAVHQADELDVAMILYTSGTTGRAKGAMISWRQIHWNVLNTTIGLQLTERDTAFLNMPLYHTGAWHVLLTPLMLLGGRLVLQRRFDPVRCNARIGPEGITILFGVPTMLRMMWEADNFSQVDFSQVRFAICGGEPCPLPVIEAYQQHGVAVRQGYGLTEAGPNCFSLPAEDAIRKRSSIGFPNFFVDVRLARQDGGEAAVDEVGELLMRGPHLFAGYWANAEASKEALRDGWIHTGDLLRCDAEGYFYVVGRKKEMYVSGGENVYPVHIERVLQKHDAIALAAVVAAPDPKWGESGWAFVQPEADRSITEAEIHQWCQQHLAGFQCPRNIIIVESLPLGHSGKINKLVLRDQVKEKLNRS